LLAPWPLQALVSHPDHNQSHNHLPPSTTGDLHPPTSGSLPPHPVLQALLPARYKSHWQHASQQEQERQERVARTAAAAAARAERSRARAALEARKAPTAVVMADHQRQMVESVIRDLHASEQGGWPGGCWRAGCAADGQGGLCCRPCSSNLQTALR
jgi:hypothetical protein